MSLPTPVPQTPLRALGSMFKTILIMMLAGLTFLGLGTVPVRIDCAPAAFAVTGASPPLFDCRYQSSRLWGLWPKEAGTAQDVSALERDYRYGAKNYKSWALRLRTQQSATRITPYDGDVIDPTVSDDFAALLRTGQPFTFRTVLVDRLLLLPGYFFFGLSLLFIAGFPSVLARRPNEPAVHRHWQQHWWRTGRDNSYLPLGPFGIPVWLGLVVLYLLGCFTLVSLADWLPPDAAKHFAGSGPALLGLIDLIRRLRTVEYCSTSPLGLEVTHHASLLDRLTFRECGWYLPILNAPLPLWLLGGAITLIQLKS